MKRVFFIISLVLSTVFGAIAQDEELPDHEGANKLQQRMALYIQKRLELTRAESEKFRPIFLRYIVELRKTHRENRSDRPMLQLKVAELRIRFRDEFRQVMDEQKANKVYDYQREFELKVIEEIRQRRLDNRNKPRQ